MDLSPTRRRVYWGTLLGALVLLVLFAMARGSPGPESVVGLVAMAWAFNRLHSSWYFGLDKPLQVCIQEHSAERNRRQWTERGKPRFPFTAVVLKKRKKKWWHPLARFQPFVVKLVLDGPTREPSILTCEGDNFDEALALAEGLSTFLEIELRRK